MKKVIVDTSVWVSFFKGDEVGKILFPLLDGNGVCINELILSELVPSLKHRREIQIIEMLEVIEKVELRIVWSQISEMQFLNLKSGINKIGIPDLIIAQNALQANLPILSLDKHFKLMKDIFGLEIYE